MQHLVALLRDAGNMLIFTGAGISTHSGIPDYRGPHGIWKKKKPIYFQDFMAGEEARLAYWEYKLEGWDAFRDARPNAVHQAIVALEQAGKLHMVVTQNIDGLHAAAGTSEQKLIELHGTNRLIECLQCGERSEPEPHFERFRAERTVPLCHCGGILKPATIMFGQSLNTRDLERAHDAAVASDLVLSLGSTLSVYPASTIPLIAARRKIPYVIINQGETDHDHLAELTLRFDADVADVLPAAVQACLS